MNPLNRFPRLNNTWVDLKHRINHWRRRRNREFSGEVRISNPKNVLIVVIDCLRADHISGFGYKRNTTPFLDDFDAAAFSNVKAASPWTFPSVPSLLSGEYPHNHGARPTSDPRNLSTADFPTRPRRSLPTLPDLLESVGYDTGMITAIPMAERAVGERFQDVSVKYTDAQERVRFASKWITDRDRWFCYLHLGDPHVPIDIPDVHHETFDIPNVDGIEDWRFRETTDQESFEAYRDARIRAYDAAIRGVDDALETLFKAIPEDTVVVVCGDHGEAFWDHPELERQLNDDPRGYYATDHGHSVLEELTRVPLWIRTPGLERGRSDQPISLVDVTPTILSALGSNSGDRVSGQPISKLAVKDDERIILCEDTAYGYNQRAVWRNGDKLITVPETGEKVAFKLDDYLEEDPLEAIPESLELVLAEFGPIMQGGNQVTVDAETRNHLEELGYLNDN